MPRTLKDHRRQKGSRARKQSPTPDSEIPSGSGVVDTDFDAHRELAKPQKGGQRTSRPQHRSAARGAAGGEGGVQAVCSPAVPTAAGSQRRPARCSTAVVAVVVMKYIVFTMTSAICFFSTLVRVLLIVTRALAVHFILSSAFAVDTAVDIACWFHVWGSQSLNGRRRLIYILFLLGFCWHVYRRLSGAYASCVCVQPYVCTPDVFVDSPESDLACSFEHLVRALITCIRLVTITVCRALIVFSGG